MPLEPYHYLPTGPAVPTTPPRSPAGPAILLNDAIQKRNVSGHTHWSFDSSPGSVDTQLTTPDPTPIRCSAPALVHNILPRIRTQDQSLGRPAKLTSHRRALSSAQNPPGSAPVRPTVRRSTTSPPDCVPLVSPISNPPSATSTFSFADSTLNSPFTLASSLDSRSGGHSRSVSASSVGEAAIRRCWYPTYRSVPGYVSGAQWNSSFTPGSSTFVPPRPSSLGQAPSYEVAQELQYVTADDPTTTLNEYLTSPNPIIDLVPQSRAVTGQGLHRYFWWDIRNLRAWDDFNLETIYQSSGKPRLSRWLEIEVRAAGLPIPRNQASPLAPSSETVLRDVCREFYAARVNAALKTCLGQDYLAMRTDHAADGPHFISNYQNDRDRTISGNGRGRVVGVVKSFDRWNTGKRHGNGVEKVEYLQGLSQLQCYMREHSCRYGFIITEIELVCVRAGTEETPYFGFLELASSVPVKTDTGLTTCMALWYLHMLAKKEPLPGQCGWKINIGAPADLTRSNVLDEKDDWIPAKPNTIETRNAKSRRGWVWPSDPFNRKKERARVWN